MDDKYTDEPQIIWAFGKWKSFNIRHIPLSCLRWYSELPLKKSNSFQMFWKAKAVVELDRRRSKDVYIHFSEHVIERFTQYWPRFTSHYQYFVDKDAGLITGLRRIFERSLLEGLAIPTKDPNRLHIEDRLYRWTYAKAGQDKEEFSVLTVIRNEKDNRE